MGFAGNHMPDRDIISFMIHKRKRQSDNFSKARVEAGGFQIDSKFSGALQAIDESFQLLRGRNSVVFLR